MNDIAIRVEGLSKLYRINGRQRNDTLRDILTDAMHLPFRRLSSAVRRPSSDGGQPQLTGDRHVWALKGVSFKVREGEVLGIIGRNGAGKSTLLKILSRITEPTEGRAEIRGRVGSLLEVGTGFHSELSGRENIYLSGAILGMKRVEIERKFDEIVGFAGVEKFIDTPVKRYSSGMQVRLAFAVAAHLEPEVLLVDEVLAVGDSEFQKKCLSRMQSVAGLGRTVLFVSHAMSAISRLCSRVIVLDEGGVRFDGPAEEGIAFYIDSAGARCTSATDVANWPTRRGPGDIARIVAVSLHDVEGRPCEALPMGQGLRVRVEVDFFEPIRAPEVGIKVESQLGHTVHMFVSSWEGLHLGICSGHCVFECTIPQLFLLPRIYNLSFWVKRQGYKVTDQVDNPLSIAIVGADVTGHGVTFELFSSQAEVYAPSSWELVAGSRKPVS